MIIYSLPTKEGGVICISAHLRGSALARASERRNSLHSAESDSPDPVSVSLSLALKRTSPQRTKGLGRGERACLCALSAAVPYGAPTLATIRAVIRLDHARSRVQCLYHSRTQLKTRGFFAKLKIKPPERGGKRKKSLFLCSLLKVVSCAKKKAFKFHF